MAVQAGFAVPIYTSGTPTALTDEPMSLVSGKTYRVTDADKRVLDPETAIVVKDGIATVGAADIAEIDHLLGTVTFDASYVVSGAVTVTGAYVPLLRFADAYAYDYTYSRTKLPSSTFSPGVAVASENSFAGVEMLAGSVQSLDPHRDDLDGHVTNERILQDVIRNGDVILFADEDFGVYSWVRPYGVDKGASIDARLEAGFNFESVVIRSANSGHDSSISFT